jgi:hypothetical protein
VVLSPRWLGPLLNCAQSVLTVKAAWAAWPECRLIAVIQCVPGAADAGTVIVMPEKAPRALVVTSASSVVSK